jgi:hypothetical protein
MMARCRLELAKKQRSDFEKNQTTNLHKSSRLLDREDMRRGRSGRQGREAVVVVLQGSEINRKR